MATADFSNEIDALQRFPSVSAWEYELRRVLGGERGHALMQVGGAEEYISSMLARAPDPALAETSFRAALDRVVGGWEPGAPCTAYHMAYMLQLVGAFLPPAGFEKLLGQLNRWDRFDATVLDVEDWPELGDLHLRALAVVSHYLPAPPLAAERQSGYQAYLRVLRAQLFHPRYAGPAASWLLRLGEFDLAGAELEVLVRRSDSVVAPLVAAVLAPVRWKGAQADWKEAGRQLSLILQNCQRANARIVFWNAVASVDGCRGMDTGDGVAVSCGGQIINLDALPDQPEQKLPATWNARQADLTEAVKKLLSEHRPHRAQAQEVA